MSNHEYWVLALIIGLVAALIVAALLWVLIRTVWSIDRSVQWNVSLKLAGSDVPEARRVNPDAIRAFLARDAWWKFVVTNDADVAEVLQLAERFALPRTRILLQPEAAHREDLLERSRWVAEACKLHGFAFSPRLHVLLWGAKRGV